MNPLLDEGHVPQDSVTSVCFISASHRVLCVPGDPSTGRSERREEKRRPPPGQTQISQHAGAEEEVQAGPLLQSQVGHDAVIAGPKPSRSQTCDKLRASAEMKRL